MATRTIRAVEETPEWLEELQKQLPLTLTLEEAAGVLRMHVRTLQRFIAVGDIRASRPKRSGGSRVIIPRSEVVRFMAEHPARD